MFGWLKRKKDEDFDSLRTQVLGEPLEEERFAPRDDFSPKTKAVFEPYSPSGVPAERPGDRFSDRLMEDRFGPPPPADQDAGKSYEIMDRLALIESQIAAVRSMTETINERLKNMESRLGLQRRY